MAKLPLLSLPWNLKQLTRTSKPANTRRLSPYFFFSFCLRRKWRDCLVLHGINRFDVSVTHFTLRSEKSIVYCSCLKCKTSVQNVKPLDAMQDKTFALTFLYKKIRQEEEQGRCVSSLERYQPVLTFCSDVPRFRPKTVNRFMQERIIRWCDD